MAGTNAYNMEEAGVETRSGGPKGLSKTKGFVIIGAVCVVAIGIIIAVVLIVKSSSKTDPKQIVFRNAKIYTGDIKVSPDKRWAEAFVINDDKIVFVGSNADAKKYQTSGTLDMDLGGKLVLPSFGDSHIHPLESFNPILGTCELWAGTKPTAFIPVLKACVSRQQGSSWVFGGGHSILDLLDSTRPPLEIIDEAIPDRPALMLEETSHSAWVNSKALQELGFDENTEDPNGGYFGRDEITGKLDGILYENAAIMASERAFDKITPSEWDLIYGGLLESFYELNKFGVTYLADARLFWKNKFQDFWYEALKRGDMKIRAILGLWAYPELDDNQLETMAKLFDDNSDVLKITQVKMYADGIISQQSAALIEPYKNKSEFIGPYGLNYFNETRLTKFVTFLDEAGFDMHIHTIGDGASLESLNAIESAQKTNEHIDRDRRHRLTHLELVDPSQYGRFKQLGVLADFQLNGDYANPAEYRKENYYFIGNRYKRILPVGSIYNAGAVVTLSSDHDVNPINPFLGIYRALSKGNESLPDIYAAVQAYTYNAAYLMRLEDKVGTIEVGKYADFIVLNQNIFKISLKNILDTKVQLTYFNGKEVFRHKNFKISGNTIS